MSSGQIQSVVDALPEVSVTYNTYDEEALVDGKTGVDCKEMTDLERCLADDETRAVLRDITLRESVIGVLGHRNGVVKRDVPLVNAFDSVEVTVATLLQNFQDAWPAMYRLAAQNGLVYAAVNFVKQTDDRAVKLAEGTTDFLLDTLSPALGQVGVNTAGADSYTVDLRAVLGNATGQGREEHADTGGRMLLDYSRDWLAYDSASLNSFTESPVESVALAAVFFGLSASGGSLRANPGKRCVDKTLASGAGYILRSLPRFGLASLYAPNPAGVLFASGLPQKGVGMLASKYDSTSTDSFERHVETAMNAVMLLGLTATREYRDLAVPILFCVGDVLSQALTKPYLPRLNAETVESAPDIEAGPVGDIELTETPNVDNRFLFDLFGALNEFKVKYGNNADFVSSLPVETLKYKGPQDLELLSSRLKEVQELVSSASQEATIEWGSQLVDIQRVMSFAANHRMGPTPGRDNNIDEKIVAQFVRNVLDLTDVTLGRFGINDSDVSSVGDQALKELARSDWGLVMEARVKEDSDVVQAKYTKAIEELHEYSVDSMLKNMDALDAFFDIYFNAHPKLKVFESSRPEPIDSSDYNGQLNNTLQGVCFKLAGQVFYAGLFFRGVGGYFLEKSIETLRKGDTKACSNWNLLSSAIVRYAANSFENYKHNMFNIDSKKPVDSHAETFLNHLWERSVSHARELAEGSVVPVLEEKGEATYVVTDDVDLSDVSLVVDLRDSDDEEEKKSEDGAVREIEMGRRRSETREAPSVELVTVSQNEYEETRSVILEVDLGDSGDGVVYRSRQRKKYENYDSCALVKPRYVELILGELSDDDTTSDDSDNAGAKVGVLNDTSQYTLGWDSGSD